VSEVVGYLLGARVLVQAQPRPKDPPSNLRLEQFKATRHACEGCGLPCRRKWCHACARRQKCLMQNAQRRAQRAQDRKR
jgi:hypothetical protein